MSKRKACFWWIDDDDTRTTERLRRSIEIPRFAGGEAKLANLCFHHIGKDEDLVTVTSALVQAVGVANTRPDLLIIDQRLSNHNAFKRLGSTLAVSLRTQAPAVPIVLVSAAPLHAVPSAQRGQFLEFFNFDSLTSGARVAELYTIASDFPKVAALTSEAKSREARILGGLGVPPEEHAAFLSCLPAEFLGPWDDETPHSFAYWVWHTLQGRPGFLYDALHVATAIGLTEKGFSNVAHRFESAQYRGFLHTPNRPRWWNSAIRMSLRQLKTHPLSAPLSTIGRSLLSSPSKPLLSSCFGDATSERVPSCVAYRDDRCIEAERVQTVEEETRCKTGDRPPVGFEPYLILQG